MQGQAIGCKQMARFDPGSYAAAVTALLGTPRLMPLDQGQPNRVALEQLAGLDEVLLFDGQPVRRREMARACLAGLWLYHDFLDESHRISQSLHGREGSYWHGIMHRREGDFANAKYWLRRAGPHPIHEALNLSARALARDMSANGALLRSSATWDPAVFVDLCADACAGRNDAAELCRRIQEREWQLLFDFCYRRALGRG
jgi:hypothetical protein